MGHFIPTKPWILLTGTANVAGYMYCKDPGEIDCAGDVTMQEFDTEDELATAVDALESEGFYMHPDNRIPPDTLEEEWARQLEWEQQNQG